MSVIIASMAPEHTAGFGQIWIPWLKAATGRDPEPEDVEVMPDPGAYYRRLGGEVFLAHVDGQVVGGVALKGLATSGFEFCKLVVLESARGHGAGRALVETCLSFASDRKAPALYLQSFNALDVALGLYRRMGFAEAPAPPEMSVLARTEIIMSKALEGVRPT